MVVVQAVEEVLRALVDGQFVVRAGNYTFTDCMMSLDQLVDQEKVGPSNYFFAFPSKATQQV